MPEDKKIIELKKEELTNVAGGALSYPEYGQTCQVRIDGVWHYGTVIARGGTCYCTIT